MMTFLFPNKSAYIWKSGILSGGKAKDVSRNLQADRYMSNSAWEKFTGAFLSKAPRTTLDNLGTQLFTVYIYIYIAVTYNDMIRILRFKKKWELTLRHLFLPAELSRDVQMCESEKNKTKKKKTSRWLLQLFDCMGWCWKFFKIFTSSVTIIGQRDVRCWQEIRSRRTRNIKNIWAETAGLGFIRKASVRRSGREKFCSHHDPLTGNVKGEHL